MTKINVFTSKKKETEQAFRDVSATINKSSKLILFFTSTTYEYERLVPLFCESFPKAKIIGLTTVGEIHNDGIHENSLVAVAFDGADLACEVVMMDNIHRFPILQRKELIDAAQKAQLNINSRNPEKEGFAIVIPNGLINAEERMLSIVNSIFTNPGFPVFGGTAGDDAKFVSTKVSLNNKISSTAGIVIFIKMKNDFKIYKESIFEAYSDEALIATRVDVEGRKVYEFNGKPAADEYARILNTTPQKLNQLFMSHPLGFVGKQLSVGSPMCVNEDRSISFYCQVSNNAEMKILKPLDVLSTMDLTVKKIHNDFKRVEATFAVNCILRKMQFQRTKLMPEVNKRFANMGNTFGFCSYGEQLQSEQINQTLILLSIGDLN